MAYPWASNDVVTAVDLNAAIAAAAAGALLSASWAAGVASNLGLGVAANVLAFPAGSRVLSIKGTSTERAAIELIGSPSTTNAVGTVAFINGTDSVASIEALRASANDAADIVFSTQAAGGANTERARIGSTGRFLIGGTQPTLGGVSPTIGVTGSGLSLGLSRFSNDTAGSILFAGKSRGTVAAAAAVATDDILFMLQVVADDGAANGTLPVTPGLFRMEVEGTVSTGIVPGRFTWQTMNAAGVRTERLRLYSGGDFRVGTGSALATTATDGFFLMPTCAGPPTGVPTNAGTGQIPMVYDKTNNRIYCYNGAWRMVAVA